MVTQFLIKLLIAVQAGGVFFEAYISDIPLSVG